MKLNGSCPDFLQHRGVTPVINKGVFSTTLFGKRSNIFSNNDINDPCKTFDLKFLNNPITHYSKIIMSNIDPRSRQSCTRVRF